MTTEQWLSLFKEAFEHANKPYTFERDFLLKDYPETPSESENEHIFQIIDTFLRYFFVKALHGETFCAVENIESSLGGTLEENYGLSQGPFINLSKTYWTFKFEVDKLPPDKRDTILFKIVRQIERSITGLFFPTPESVAIPLAKRIESQRQFLNEYASQMDISRFLAENPIFKKELSKQGRFGIILLVISLIFIFLLIVLLKLY